MAGETPLAQTLTSAVNLAKAGRVDEAIGVLAGGANGALIHPVGRNVLGALYMQNGQTVEALASFEEAVRLAPTFADAHCNRGVVLQKLGRYPEALAAYDAAIGYAPDLALALFNRGNVLKLLGRLDEAVVAFGQALQADPKLAAAYLNRGHVQMVRRDYIAALTDFEAAAALNVGSEAQSGRISALVSLMRFESALAAADEALARNPLDADSAAMRGQILLELDRPDEAIAAIDRLGGSDTLDGKRLIVTSGALWRLGRREEALAAASESVRRRPDDPQTHQGLAHMSLAVGDFARGWDEYEHRGEGFDPGQAALEARAPRWQGDDVTAKTVLVFAEQGLGDTIQFARYLAALNERAAAVQVVVQPSLLELMKSLRAPVDWSRSARAVGDFDVQIPLLSLPRIFATRLDTIPSASPYLFANDDRVAEWREKLGSGGFKIGIVWQGNPQFKNDRRRSVPLDNFAPLVAIPGVRLISLQAVHGLDQLTRLPAGTAIETLGAKVTDNPEGLNEIAAVMANLDLVVTSDTAAAHLAGALGRPVWVALSHDPDWRWLRDRADSPWYPTMRVFRQRTQGDWPGVFAEIAAALREIVARKG